MINLLIVEDGINEITFYEKALKDMEEINTLFAASAEEALVQMKDTLIDLFLLDVELPGMNGFELAYNIRNMDIYGLTTILFVTGHDSGQLEAFKRFHCYDYITKPFKKAELIAKILELGKQIEKGKKSPHKSKLLSYPQIGKHMLIPTEQICYAEIQRGICYLYTELQTEPFKTRHFTLTELLEEVDEPDFVRCHKSFAVNIKKMMGIRDINYRNWQVLIGQELVAISMSKKYYGTVKKQFELWAAEQKKR